MTASGVKRIYASIVVLLVCASLLSCEEDAVTPEPEDTKESVLVRNRWYPASPPVAAGSAYLFGSKNDLGREPVRWYNTDRVATRRDFNPALPEDQDTPVSTLHIEVDSLPSDSLAWTGIMRGFAPTDVPDWSRPGDGYLDLSDAIYISVWVNDFRPDPYSRGGTLFIELGFIDEDFYRPDRDSLESEDTRRDGFTALIDDTGLDGIYNEDSTPQDPDDGDDDFAPHRIQGRFIRINGTERNSLLDTEDLDGSGQLDWRNGYLRYRLNLVSPASIDIRRDHPDYKGFKDPNDAWRRYLVRLDRYEAVVPDGVIPQLHKIHHLRVWFNNMDQVLDPSALHVQLAGLSGVN